MSKELTKRIGTIILTTAVLDQSTEVEIKENKRADLFKVDPRNIAPNPNNHRQISVEDADMQTLIASIRENGVITPLMLKPNPNFEVDGDNREYVSYAGNRRITAVMAIINDTENPMEIKYVPAQIKKHVTLDDEYLTQIIENSGVPFTFLEKAEVVEKLINVCGWTPAEVEKQTGEPQSMISNFLTVTGWTKKHKKMIADNDISAQLALRIARESETTEEFSEKMEELFNAAQEIKASGQHKAGSKRAVITEKNASVIVEKNARKILEKVWLKLEKEGVTGKNVDLLMDITTELKKPTKLTVSRIYKLFVD